MAQHFAVAQPADTEIDANVVRVPEGTDLVEWYFEQGWTDGLPVVPPTRARVDTIVEALGGDPHFVECKVPPRHGSLSREVLAINMVMAGCKPEYAPVVRAAMLALTADAFNLNGVQATTHMAAPLLIVNGAIAREIGMNGDCNAFGSGNRANATIGRALRLVLLNVGGGWPGELDKSTLGHPGKYTYCVAENEMASPWAPYHVEKGFSADDSTVFVLAAEPPHSVTNHVANDPEGILDSIASAMSTIANNNAVSRWCIAAAAAPALDAECAAPSATMSGSRSVRPRHRGRSDEMAYFVGLDVSVKETSVCVVDEAGKVILEQKVLTEPDTIIALLTSLGVSFGRIGIEAGPLSQWLVNALTGAELPVICVETRHMKALLTAQQINKTDRNDARGIAQMMRVGLFKPVNVKTLVAQEQRMLLTSRKLLQRKLLDVESDLRGTLRNFGLKVGV